MPTYEYKCENGHHHEIFQGISEDPIEKCPDCGGILKRLIGNGAGIIFKGSGFYATDYKKKASASEPPCKTDSPACQSCPAAQKSSDS